MSQLTDSGITSIFVPGGDLDEPMGEYDSSAAVLRDLAEMDHPFTDWCGLLSRGAPRHFG